MLKKILLVISLFITSTIQGFPSSSLNVFLDGGGRVDLRLKQMKLLDSENIEVRIIGECDSACTLFLSLKNVCVYPNAKLGFHAIEIKYNGELVIDRNYTKIIENKYYNQHLREFLLSEHALDKIEPFIYYMTGKQIISFGYRQCN